MEKIELKNVIIENIPDDYLESVGFSGHEFTYADRVNAWKRNISGSKIKTILATPLSTLAYYLGWISEDDLDAGLRHIPRLNFFRDFGSVMEPYIVNMFNTAIINEHSDNPKLTVLRDILVDSSAVYRVRQEFAPNMRDKLLIKQDKRSFIMDKQDSPDGIDLTLFMANIDGYTSNIDGSIKSIVEIKTKTGADGERFELHDFYKLHIDQISFYWKMLKPSDGAYLLVDHYSRGYKIHKFTNEDLEAHWNTIKPAIMNFASAYMLLLRMANGEKSDEILQEALDNITKLQGTSPTEECITSQDLITMVKRLGGKYE